MAAGLCLEVLLIAEIDQRVQAVYGFDDNIAAATAIAAIGTAILNMRLTPEAYATGAAVTAFDEYFCGIEKLHRPVIRFADFQTRLSPVRQNEA